MRRHQQNQILELVQTQNEAIAQLSHLLLLKDFSSTMTLLADCQDSAVQIGEYIERTEGEGTQTVALLEEYCEELYQAGIRLDKNCIDGFMSLYGQLAKIENSVKSELKPNRLEVVFLSYKASMCDSLESIWHAAKSDSQCDAYFVAIPYFDRLPGGSVGLMHYEGGMHPANIPITDYRVYNIAERHPDVIFFNNPYDGSNYVTSVHPDYYSKQLRDFTDLLVYVPYFVSTGDVGEHFCTTSACVYADRVVVQSQKIRDTYIRVFKAFEKDTGIKGQFGNAEEKFVALGSPKFDKVINAKLTDFTIPDVWRNLTDRNDGTRKKIILYNTTLVAMLMSNDDAFKKLRYVFHVFKNREDVVLWWRPHPLNEAAYQSMRPQIQNEYRQIVDEYRSEGFGIYDDTADLNRAIALSDAYYGDYSSLVALYQCTGKPILQQTVAALYSRKHTLLSIVISEDERGLWLISKMTNGLFYYEKKTGETRYIGSFPMEETEKAYLYYTSVRLKDKLYFAPMTAEHIGVYNLADGSFSSIDLPKYIQDQILATNQTMFCLSVASGDYLFMIGHSYPVIIRFCTKTGTFTQFTDLLPAYEKLLAANHPNGTQYFDRMSISDSVIAFLVPCANAVVLFDIKTCVSTVFQIGASENRYSGICFDGTDYWLSVYEGHIVVRWNAQTRKWKEIATGIRGGSYAFINALYYKSYIWIIPYTEKILIKVEPNSESIEKIDLSSVWPPQTEEQEEAAFVPSAYMDCILFPQYHGPGIMMYNVKTGNLDCHHLITDHLSDFDYSSSYGDLHENYMHTLHNYLDDVAMRYESDEVRFARAQARRRSIIGGDGLAGERIYAMAKKQIWGAAHEIQNAQYDSEY